VIRVRKRLSASSPHRSTAKRVQLSLLPLSAALLFFPSLTGLEDVGIKEFQKIDSTYENIVSLFGQYVYQQNGAASGRVNFAVESLNFYKETDLNTGASSYFTKVVVTRDGEEAAPIDLRLALHDGTVIDTSWSDSSNASTVSQVFEFQTVSAPEYAQLDPGGKIKNDSDYSDNSLTVADSLLPVVKWIGRVLNFLQNVLLSVGTVA
jgi:hypothetical protein